MGCSASGVSRSAQRDSNQYYAVKKTTALTMAQLLSCIPRVKQHDDTERWL
jgi:hypothetical protein